MNSSKSIIMEPMELKLWEQVGPRERIQEKGRGVKMGLGEPRRGGT